MQNNQARETVEHYILENTGMEEIGHDIHLFEEGLVSSLFAIQLMTFLEHNFNIEVTMDDLDFENFKSINSIIEFVSSKKVA